MSYHVERERFMMALVIEHYHHRPNIETTDPLPLAMIHGAAAAILRAAQGLTNIAVADCNRELTDRDRQRRARLLLALERGTAELYGGKAEDIETSGDPRGCVVKLKLPTGRANDFGGEGFYCVPTR